MTAIFDDVMLKHVDELKRIRAEMASLREREKLVRDAILGALEKVSATSAMTASGRPVVHLESYTRTSVDTKKLEALYSDVYEDCLRETPVTNVKIDDPNVVPPVFDE